MPPYQTFICNRTVEGSTCGACTIYGGEVQLLYFPVAANASRNYCAQTGGPVTTCPLGPTTAPYTAIGADIGGICESYVNCPYLIGNTSTTDSGPYVVTASTTLYQNRAYISLKTAYASNSCGYVGGQHAGSVVTVASSQVFSVNRAHGEDCADYGYSFDFANLLPNLPFSAFNTAVSNNACHRPRPGVAEPDALNGDWVNGQQIKDTQPCDTIVDWAYYPLLVVPTQIREMDAAWATCAVALDGLYDPPKALTAQTTTDGPSGPAGVQTTTAASPASTVNNNSPTATGIATSVAPSTQPAQASSTANADPGNSGAGSSGANSGVADPGTSAGSGAAESSSANLGAAGSILSQALSTATNPATSQGSGNTGAAGSKGAGSNSGSSDNSDAAASQGSGANSGFGSGSNGASSAALDPSTISVGFSAFTVVATQATGSSAMVVANGGVTATLTAGQTLSIGGQAVSAGSTGGVVIGSGSAAATVVPAASIGSGSSAAQFSGVVISVGSSSSLTAVQTVVTSSNGEATTQAIIGGSTIAQGGAAATINGQTISLGSDGVIVGSSTQAVSVLAAATASGAVVQVGTSSLTAVQSVITGSNGQLTTQAVIGGTTTTQGGAAATINGQVVSLGSSGVVGGGSTTQAISALATNAAPSSTFLAVGSALVTASQTVVTGSNGQRTTEVILAGTVLTQSESAAVVSGHTLSLGSNGIIIDGSQTATISTLNAGSAITGSVVTLGSSTLTASRSVVTGADGKLATEAIVAGSTLISGGAPVTIDGDTLSLGSAGIVVDGKQTTALSSISPSITGALVTLGPSTLTASQTVITGTNGPRTTEVIIGGSTLVSGGAPITLSGHTLTYRSNGVVVDGTQTDPVSTFAVGMTATPVVFTEHGQVFTATPIPGRSGVYIVDGQTISVGGSQVTVDGLTLTAQSSGLVVDGTQTISCSKGVSPARLTAASGPSVSSTGPSPTATTTKKSAADSLVAEKIMGSLVLARIVAVLMTM
ncbi:hypothetical protein LTR78_007365 [Recurvomyces mirabilis]|uniref:Uncharacterized protein n=2 Tax=Recurvomyces mirabilis TaxID=574656 RepID=A0AAE1BYH3_9PEZI|nr:hypothetical protein LTR78_007365 [Recurvomyces mirabilis]